MVAFHSASCSVCVLKKFNFTVRGPFDSVEYTHPLPRLVELRVIDEPVSARTTEPTPFTPYVRYSAAAGACVVVVVAWVVGATVVTVVTGATVVTVVTGCAVATVVAVVAGCPGVAGDPARRTARA